MTNPLGTLPDPYAPPMRGIGGAKTIVADYLRTALPTSNAALRTMWQLTDNTDPAVNLLPDPDMVLDVEQGVLDANNLVTSDTTSCLIFISGLTTPKIDEINFSPVADAIYDVTYQLSATAWLKGHRRDNMIRARDNVGVAIRYALLSDTTVGTSSSAGWQALLDRNTITEQYPYPDFDTTVARGDRHMMMVGVGFRIQVREGVGTPLIGYVTEITDTATIIGQPPEQPVPPPTYVSHHPADPKYM